MTKKSRAAEAAKKPEQKEEVKPISVPMEKLEPSKSYLRTSPKKP